MQSDNESNVHPNSYKMADTVILNSENGQVTEEGLQKLVELFEEVPMNKRADTFLDFCDKLNRMGFTVPEEANS